MTAAHPASCSRENPVAGTWSVDAARTWLPWPTDPTSQPSPGLMRGRPPGAGRGLLGCTRTTLRNATTPSCALTPPLHLRSEDCKGCRCESLSTGQDRRARLAAADHVRRVVRPASLPVRWREGRGRGARRWRSRQRAAPTTRAPSRGNSARSSVSRRVPIGGHRVSVPDATSSAGVGLRSILTADSLLERALLRRPQPEGSPHADSIPVAQTQGRAGSPCRVRDDRRGDGSGRSCRQDGCRARGRLLDGSDAAHVRLRCHG